MSFTTADMPNLGAPPLDERGNWRREWVLFLQAMFFRTGGAGTPTDITSVQKQTELSYTDSPMDPALQDAIRVLGDLWAEQRPAENLSLILGRLDTLENQLQPSTDLTAVLRRIEELESLLVEMKSPPVPVLEPWNAPTLTNSWVNFGAPYNPAGYWKDPYGVVHLRGTLKSGTMSTAAFTLPAGYIPPNRERFSNVSNSAFGAFEVRTDGTVVPFAGSNVDFCIDGATFRVT